MDVGCEGEPENFGRSLDPFPRGLKTCWLLKGLTQPHEENRSDSGAFKGFC